MLVLLVFACFAYDADYQMITKMHVCMMQIINKLQFY